MIDLLLRNGRTAAGAIDIGVHEGQFVAPSTEAGQVIDLGGRWVTPPLVEPHIHLDAVLTVGQPRANVSG